MKKVAIIYLLCNDEPEKYLENALKGVASQTYTKENISLVIVYNPIENADIHLQYIHETIGLFETQLPKTIVLPQQTNLGFSGGNNLGMQWAVDNNFDYVFLHNADGFTTADTISSLVGAMEEDKKIGQAQSLILLYPEQNLINTTGNKLHYLDIGYCGNFREPIMNHKLPAVYDIGYASGASTMLRVDLLKQYGFWLGEFFMYHEDTEYSLRLKIRDFRIVAVSNSVFYHQYQFSKNVKKFFWIERNRHVLKYLFYKWPTIILTIPLEILYNLGLLVIAWKNNWLKELFKGYIYWLKPSTWHTWYLIRLKNLKERKISDRDLLNQSVKTVEMAEVVVSKPIKLVMNAVFTFYYFLLKILVRW